MLADKIIPAWPGGPRETTPEEPAAAETAAPAQDDSPLEAFIQQAVKNELEKESRDSRKLKELAKGLDWLKDIIETELNRRVESRLLTYKLLYAGYFGSKGRQAKYAHNPCAIRDAIRFCKDNSLPPPDWTLSYIHGLMMGVENLPSRQDEKRWNTLMKLLDIAAEWDKKAKQGMSPDNIEVHFRRRGVSDEAISLARSFINEPGEQSVTEFSQKYHI